MTSGSGIVYFPCTGVTSGSGIVYFPCTGVTSGSGIVYFPCPGVTSGSGIVYFRGIMSSPLNFSEVRVADSIVLCIAFC